MSHGSEFVEVADRVWVARHEWYDVNVTAVGGERGLVVVDTHASALAGQGVLDGLRRLDAGDVVAVVATHEHFDHVLGTGVLTAAYDQVTVHAHEACAAALPAHLDRVRAQVEAGPADDPYREELLDALASPVLPDTTFSSVAVLDLGDRALELVHPGRGHTAGDLVVHVPDARVLLAGDLVESSDRGDATPGLGPDCHPLDWPLSLDLVLQLITPDAVVVPGHGPTVDRDFVQAQRADLGVVAETIRDLAGRGVPVAEALGAAEWPFDVAHLADAVRVGYAHLADAVRVGYAHLPAAQRRLPLV